MSNELKRLQAERKRVNERIGAIEMAARDKENTALVGRCFKFRNSYSCPEKPSDYWWLYLVVLKAAKGGLYTFEFQTDRHGEFDIKPRGFHYNIGDDYQQISRTEFDRAWKQTRKEIASLVTVP